MKNSDFTDSPSGILVPTIYGQKAFLPNPLPPQLDLGKIALQLGEAGQRLGELRGACRRLINPYILIRPLQRLEAQTSSAMEDTHTTTDELVFAEAGVGKSPTAEALEVRNYITALSHSISELQELPISGRLLKSAHCRLLTQVSKTRGSNKSPGHYFKDQNMIGARPLSDPQERLASARFIPPPPFEKENTMADLERYINRGDVSDAQFLIDLALVHYQFETIHPFGDGNGRIGRMLISLMPMAQGVLEMPVLYISPELEDRKSDYIDLMYRVSSEGCWEEWIDFFLLTLGKSCTRTVSTIDRVLELHNSYQAQARSASRSNNMNQLIDMFFETPVVDVKDVVQRIGITDAAARNLLRQLSGLGIIRERLEHYPTLWTADELIEVSRP